MEKWVLTLLQLATHCPAFFLLQGCPGLRSDPLVSGHSILNRRRLWPSVSTLAFSPLLSAPLLFFSHCSSQATVSSIWKDQAALQKRVCSPPSRSGNLFLWRSLACHEHREKMSAELRQPGRRVWLCPLGMGKHPVFHLWTGLRVSPAKALGRRNERMHTEHLASFVWDKFKYDSKPSLVICVVFLWSVYQGTPLMKQ